jgi:hypothetical protein
MLFVGSAALPGAEAGFATTRVLSLLARFSSQSAPAMPELWFSKALLGVRSGVIRKSNPNVLFNIKLLYN